MDDKAKSIIGNVVTPLVFHRNVDCTTTKKTWDTLCTIYEGTTLVKNQKKKNLNRAYENFFCQKDKSLTNIYTRYTCLINDLHVVGVVKDNLDVVEKFVDVLSDHLT